MNIAEICNKARDLILRDGFMTGGAGWVGDGGWCIEGALGKAMGLDQYDYSAEAIGDRVNVSPVGMAIHEYLALPAGMALHGWNDRSGTKEGVLRVLAEVAAKHTPQEEPVYEPPQLEEKRILGPVVIPPMPTEKPRVRWISELLRS